MKEANEKGVKVLVFPELVLTGCTCYDLYTQRTLLNGAEKALAQVIKASEGMDVLAFVGLPFLYETRLYSCAAAVYDGELLGMVPRTYVKGTHFVPADDQVRDIIVDGVRQTCSRRSHCHCTAGILPHDRKQPYRSRSFREVSVGTHPVRCDLRIAQQG